MGKHAQDLRNRSEANEFDRDAVINLLSVEQHPIGSKRAGLKIPYAEVSPFFPPTVTRTKVKETIIKALEFYFSARKEERM